ncbi:SPOR domain-containing protein [Actibacterium sp. 188UL27-1]|nr:SPOR domain-containing protein [Actibacterium sp. 188UL27-1]
MDPRNGDSQYRAGSNDGLVEGASLLNWVGAIVSLALVAALITWGYQLAVRDVSGVPVIRALDGPMRVQPENPGGRVAEHQGLAVNSVQSAGVAEAPADRLVLAPEAADLADEDQPRTRLVTPQDTPSAEAEAGAETATTASDTTPEITQAPPVDPIEAAVRLANGPGAANATAQEGAADDLGPGLKRSIIPQRRPASRPAAPTASVEEATRAAAAPTAIAASTVPSGTRLVQLGAPDTAAAARQLWADLSQGSFRPLMEDKQMLIQEAVSGGKTFYRLRAMGFTDLSDARRFCAALVAERAECIPVVAR